MPISNLRRRWFVAFFATLACFIVANLVAVHLHSDAGLLEGLGLVDRWQDDIRRVGFPFQFFEEGGEVHRRIFSSLALLLDLAIAIAAAAGVALVYRRIYDRFEHGRV